MTDHVVVYARVPEECPLLRWEPIAAFPVAPGKVKLASIPVLATELGRGDLVETDAENRIVRVLETGARTRRGVYATDGTPDDVRRRWLAIAAFLREWEVAVSPDPLVPGAPDLPGIFVMAVPSDLDDEGLADLCTRCPVPWLLVIDDTRFVLEQSNR